MKVDYESGTKAHDQSVDLRSAGRVRVLDSQHCGSLDHRLPVFGVRRDRSYSSLARGDHPIFSRLFLAVAKTGEPAIAGAICSSGNLDRRPIHVDIQCEFLWRRPYSAGCLAVFCLRHIIVSAVYVCDVRLRWHSVRSVAYNLAASHPREFPRQRSVRRYGQLIAHRCPESAVLPRMAASSDCGSRIRTIPFLRTRPPVRCVEGRRSVGCTN